MATATVNPTSKDNTEVTANGPQSTETEVARQSYSFKLPKNFDGVLEIFGDTPEGKKALTYALRAGMKQIYNNRLRAKATEKDEDGKPKFQAQEGVIDITPFILDAPQRQQLSQREKLRKNLEAASLPAPVIDNMLKQYDESVGTDNSGGNVFVDTNEFSLVLGGKEGKTLVMRVGRPADEEDED